MKPSRIFVIRHGESVGNVDRTIYATVPDWKVPLTNLGAIQSQEAGRDLRARGIGEPAVYLSPYLRTRQTWENLGIKSAFVREDPRIIEQSWGNLRAYEPRAWADVEIERDAYGSFYYRFLHGESGTEVYDRCEGFIGTLYRDFEKDDYPETALIVTHGFTMRVLLMRWLHWTVDYFHTLRNPRNAEIVELRLGDDDKYHLLKPLRTYPHET